MRYGPNGEDGCWVGAGVFADHGWGTNIGHANKDGTSTLCNGAGSKRSCWNFTAAFSSEFNEAHRWILNASQDMLAKLPTKGVTVNGPYSQWGRPACDFASLRESSLDPVGHAVVEYSKGGCLNGGESRADATSCMAAFMMWMRPGMYFSCVDPHESRTGALPPFYAEWEKKLGPASGPAKEVSPGRWSRSFQHPSLSKPTVVSYQEDGEHGRGTIEWADGPAGPPRVWPAGPPSPVPPSPPGPPAPAGCGKCMAGA